uniref:Chemokine interleukin-8-like domain-containing protein n=1 Tax=Oreochromis niloticus TaxID=8128 RepID=A0A669F6S8_ORENI
MLPIRAVVVIALTVCLTANTSAGLYLFPSCPFLPFIDFRLPYSTIKGYSVQIDTEMCPINAIIFHTKKGKVCANPALKWVIDAIDQISEKFQLGSSVLQSNC